MSSEAKRADSRRAEPEVFETPELDHQPEAAPRAEETKDSENILTPAIKPQLAFEKFAGKVYNTSKTNFADPAIHNVAQRGEYTSFSSSQRAFESPMERFTRLKDEVAQFKAELETLSQQADAKAAGVSGLSSLIAQELASVDHDLKEVSSNRNYTPFLSEAYTEETAAEQRVLLDRLSRDVQAAQAVAGGDAKAQTGASDHITYELYYNPALDRQREQLNTQDLDRRVAAVEKTIGDASQMPSGYADIHSALTYLQRRVEVLDVSTLDTVYRRIRTLMGELDQLQQAKAAAEAQQSGPEVEAKQKKIDEIYALMSKWDTAAQQLPQVVSRLQSLRELHEETAQAVLRIQAVDSEFTAVDQTLKRDEAALQKVEKSLAENATTMKQNMEALQKRMADLEAKMKRL